MSILQTVTSHEIFWPTLILTESHRQPGTDGKVRLEASLTLR